MSTKDPTFLANQDIHYDQDRRVGITVCIVVLLVVAYIAVLLKWLVRRLTRTDFARDDYWIWASLGIYSAYTGINVTLVHYGLGLHVIRVKSLKDFVTVITIATCFYHVSILSIKLSILYFYRRLFAQRNFKLALLIIGATIVSSTIAFEFLAILHCVPLTSLWDPEVKGKCVDNFNAVVITSGVINVVTDFTILLLPIPLLWNLQVSKAKRCMIISTFMLAGIVCAVGTVRCFYLHSFEAKDTSWASVETVELSSVEIGIGILFACLPTYKPILNRIFLGQATSNVLNAHARYHGPSSRSSHKGAIRMAGLMGNDAHHNLASRDDDEELLYTGQTVTSVHAGGNRADRTRVQDGTEIAVVQ